MVLSSGKPDVSVPSLAGMTCAQATAALASAHFQAVCAPGTYNNNVPATVLVLWSINATQNPTKAPYGSTITLVPSLGHEPATVPNIPGTYSFAQAQAALSAVGLTAHTGQPVEHDRAGGRGDLDLARQRGPGALRLGGLGERVDGAPDDHGAQRPPDTVAAATAALSAAGPERVGCVGQPSDTVTGTQPSIGSTVPTGSAVQLFT